MTYTFTQPTRETLKDFLSVANPHADAAYEATLGKLERGEYDLSSRWLFTSEHGALAALTRYPSPRPIYALRAVPDLGEDDVLRLLEFAAGLGEGDEPATLNYNLETSGDVSALALAQGWSLEANVKGFRTNLCKRGDLEADPAARPFALSELLTDDFRAFYEPIWTHDVEGQELESLTQEIANFSDHNAENSEGVYLLDGETPVAAGVVNYDEPASMTLIGVLPDLRGKGYGRRLHRQLMWLAQQRAVVYQGSAAVSNTAMLRVFEANGCTLVTEVWQLKAPRKTSP